VVGLSLDVLTEGESRIICLTLRRFAPRPPADLAMTKVEVLHHIQRDCLNLENEYTDLFMPYQAIDFLHTWQVV
jgi:hypothetical protein